MENALTKVENFNLPAMNDSMKQAFQEEMAGLQITFDRVKIPSGGGLAFEVPGDDPNNPDMVKELVGVIVDQHPVNAFWSDKYSGQNNPPDCSSMDGKVGIERATGAKRPCNSCPYNAWGSAQDGTNGKACKNMRRVYILREGEMFPLLLTLPPTSLKNFSDFMAKRIVGKGRRSSEVITKVTLKKTNNSGGIQYSQAVFAVAGVLDPETAQKAAEYAANIKPITRSLEVGAEEFQGSSNNDFASVSEGYDPF